MPGAKPIHRNARESHGTRCLKKLTGNVNWWKDKNESELPSEDEALQGQENNYQSRNKTVGVKGKYREGIKSKSSKDYTQY